MKESLPKLNEEQLKEMGRELLPTEALRESLEMSDRGNPKQTIGNAVRILKEDPKLSGAIKLNELTDRIDIVKDLGWERDGTVINDVDMAYIAYYMEDNYGIGAESIIEKAIQIVANENRYHPIRELLSSLVWDGVPRVENALTHFLGVEKTEFTTESFRLFLFGAVERVFKPGCKFDTSLVLVGDQGAGKSTFFRLLAMKDEYFSDDMKKLDDEKVFAKLQGHWIFEMPEMLAALNARNVEEIKSFLSRQKDTYRTPYDKHPKDRKRQCVFGGTSNRLEVLPMDKSGNRRILPIETHMDRAEVHILENEEESRAYMTQVWAEIMEDYRTGHYSLILPEHLARELTKYQERFTPEDSDVELIAAFLDETNEKFVCVSMLAREALSYSEYDRLGKVDRNKIAEIMHTMKNWEPVGQHSFVGYGRQRGWKRKTEMETGNGFVPIQEELPFTTK